MKLNFCILKNILFDFTFYQILFNFTKKQSMYE